jgi:hypothetical protein
LNTAASWLLNRELADLPERIRPAASQLRTSLQDEQIGRIEFWYVHNLPESKNVANELKTVQATAHAGVKRFLKGGASLPNVDAIEVGRTRLDEWYRALTTPILVSDTFQVEVPGGYKLDGSDWSSFVTAIPGLWLHKIFNEHKDKLFSANIRGYLGSRKTDANINNGIKNTAHQDPDHFWVYNNGLTILTNDFTYDEDRKALAFMGISIVNGAQTTGSIGSLTFPPNDSALVPARFVKCQKKHVVARIIQFNNSQNQVEAPDFRSGDNIQSRLRKEFAEIPSAEYFGGRRGGYEDRIRRPSSLIPSDTVGQSLAAFHGNPVVAYNEKSKIWESNTLYSSFFSDKTTAKHIVFVYSLLRAIEKKKQELLEEQKLTEKQTKTLAFFRNRGATFLFTYAVSACLETLLGRPIPDKFSLSFKENFSPQQAIEHWEPIVHVATAFADKLAPAVETGLKSNDGVKHVVGDFVSFMEATRDLNDDLYSGFAKIVQS